MSTPGQSEEQGLAERVVAAMLGKDAFSRWLGVSVLEVRPRYAAVRMTVRDEMVNGFGVSHGGIAYSVADSALAFASNTHGRVTVSIENAITYPAPVHVGDVITAVAEEESASNRLAYFRVTVRKHDDTIVGLFRGTVYKTNQEFFTRDGASGEGGA
jgi:acyl-CoA thioesterase